MLITRIAAGLFVVLLMVVAGGPSASAAGPVDCGPDGQWDGATCRIKVSVETQGSGGTALGSNSGGTPRSCAYGTFPMPCSDPDLGYWSESRSCYVRLSAVQPPTSMPVWDGHTDGAIYDCSLPRSGGFGGLVLMFWAATAPAGPDPRVLAQTAIASMNLRPISIGVVPEDRPGSVGLVGLPVWMWAANPDDRSWGPITRTASAGGSSVTATAKVQKVRWLMGDGGVVVCTGPGTVYEDRFGKSMSPTCGYKYTKQGVYTVRAETSWSVSWSGMGQSGTIPLTLSGSTMLTIGELQILTSG